ncbi:MULTISPECIES: arabinose transporter [unclassified Mesorhizobium]|uniref:arabinose transporter n=1 Tax=unclassified Mesorhizobium TaxID=325217 RepID=UPI000FDB8205|nr:MULTISPECIES: arabinose transporter [unclassified Mesorhizobium]TGQ12248.1 MFS transporter [Mesorhizobium sp. M2E.F.Ca.ET.219.01.1.1]TGT68069.1 MFS transporter [Mesorhizobium sp. M2E.F.Ca.ET.166.01.1.1]TGW01071.1 MFS transporter [Mesorhizobium sp. M2E.F.Ca.ET.154.01.1.1]
MVAMDTARNASAAMAGLLPIMAAVFAGFLLIGLALPVLPLHLHQGLGFGPFAVGLVTGSQFVASLLSRIGAGNYADARGGKRAVVVGLIAAALAGFIYLGSLALLDRPAASASMLFVGRAVLGAAESFIITGGVAWELALAGGQHSGKVIAWVGTAMFAALALGAPVGSALYAAGGFAAIAFATIVLPFATLLATLPMHGVGPAGATARQSWTSVAQAVWLPGVGAALSSLGYGAILSFAALLFSERGWHPVWLPFTAYAASLIAARLCFGQLPDRLGGARVAAIFVAVEAVGLLLIWSAPGPLVATLGAGLTGLGYSLVYPGLGAEALSHLPSGSRGLAMGLYTVFLDVALGFGSPVLGLVAASAGLQFVFLAVAAAAVPALAIALLLRRKSSAVRRV